MDIPQEDLVEFQYEGKIVKGQRGKDIPQEDLVEFQYEGKTVKGQRGKTIAAALHQAGYPVHSHSLDGRNRSLNCGIGKCGACEMLVDGVVRRICITKVDGVKEVRSIDKEANILPEPKEQPMASRKCAASTRRTPSFPNPRSSNPAR